MVISSPSNRSPSPMSTSPNQTPNPNPNSRTQQEREGGRKSFILGNGNGNGNGNGKPSIVSQPRSFIIPNTPANSPAEFGRRASFSRDHHHEQKENDRDLTNLKPIARPRSPSISKGSKNFMSPTISAASKINPSPRKKVLGERNEAIRTSASLSDGKFQFFSTMSSLEFSHENEPKGESENRATEDNQIPEKNVTESEFDSVVISPEVPVEAEFESNAGVDVKNTTCSSPSVIPPLDAADPAFPPYDPNTNFLSPRPQFLCYRPNPRINQGLNLDDQFASETSEETHSQISSKEQEDSFSSSSYSEGVSSPREELPMSFESNQTETQETEKEAAATKTEPRPRFFTKTKALAFVLVLLLSFIAFYVTYDPGFGNAMSRDEVIAKLYDNPRVVVDLAKANFNDVFQRAKLWSAHSVDHLSQMIHNWREVNTFNPVLYSNLTGWQEEEDYFVGEFEFGSFFERKDDVDYVVGDLELSYFVEKDEGHESTIDSSVDNFAELQSKPETEEQAFVVEETNMADELDDFKPETVEENYALPLEGHENSLIEVEVLNAEMQSNQETEKEEKPEEVEENSALPLMGHENSLIETEVLNAEMQSNQETEKEEKPEEVEKNSVLSFLGHEKCLIEAEVLNAEIQSKPETEVEEEESAESYVLPLDHGGNSMIEEETYMSVELQDEFQTEDSSEGFSSYGPEIPPQTVPRNSQLVGSSMVAVSLLTVAAFMYLKRKKCTSAIPAPVAAHQLETEMKSVACVKDPIYECQPSCSGPVEVDNMMSEPCPSEMSSFQKTSSHSHSKRGGRNGIDEAQSQSLEKMPKRDYNKRESLASSSSEFTMCSSYGSFTTYSKIPSKKGDEDMVVTPVRRSSRIRSKVISP